MILRLEIVLCVDTGSVDIPGALASKTITHLSNSHNTEPLHSPVMLLSASKYIKYFCQKAAVNAYVHKGVNSLEFSHVLNV